MPPTSKRLREHIAMACPTVRAFVRLSVRHAFQTSHIFVTMYARILIFHICIANEKLAEPFFFLLSDTLWWSLGPFSDLGILANENLVSKISKEPLE